MNKGTKFLQHLYGLGDLLVKSCRYAVRRPFYIRTITEQMDLIGVNSLSIVVLSTLFMGMVLALQSGVTMARFGAKMYVGTVVGVSIIRELGPVLAALVVAGRVGAGITAEIGSMQVTEQLDAMRAMGTNPIKKLVVTRLVATTIMLPILTIVGDIVGILGGLVIAITSLGIGAPFYEYTVVSETTFDDLLTGMAKPIVFGLIISLVGCYMGITTSGGTKGVGRAATMSVVISSIAILVVDFFLGKLFLAFLSYT